MHAVAEKKPNPWGLYDMLGNSFQWCSDCYGGNLPDGAVDPVGPLVGDQNALRVLRGGSWNMEARKCRSAFRNKNPQRDYRGGSDGFRVAMDF